MLKPRFDGIAYMDVYPFQPKEREPNLIVYTTFTVHICLPYTQQLYQLLSLSVDRECRGRK